MSICRKAREPLIAVGQTAIGGETVIADLAARDPQRTFRVG